MWSEKKPNGKYIFRERYTDPMTGKQKIVSVTLDRDTAASRKKAEQALLSKILSKTSGIQSSGMTLGALSDIYHSSEWRCLYQWKAAGRCRYRGGLPSGRKYPC